MSWIDNVPYKNEEEFIRGQKIKLVLIVVFLAVACGYDWLAYGDPFWWAK